MSKNEVDLLTEAARVARLYKDADLGDLTDGIYAALDAAEARGRAEGYAQGRRDFQFAPEGDNHHNARLCPYCSPAEVTRG